MAEFTIDVPCGPIWDDEDAKKKTEGVNSKKPYSPPRLTKLGTARELIQGISGESPDNWTTSND